MRDEDTGEFDLARIDSRLDANGEYDDVDGSVDTNVSGGDEVEQVFSITCRSAEMSVGDTLDIRCQTGAANLDEYDVTAECTVVAGAAPVIEVTSYTPVEQRSVHSH